MSNQTLAVTDLSVTQVTVPGNPISQSCPELSSNPFRNSVRTPRFAPA